MKQLTKHIFLFALLSLAAYSASAQKHSLYYSRTLYDGIQNPHHKSLDSCRSWATNFFLFPSFNFDFSIVGQADGLIKSALAGENISTSIALREGYGQGNEFATRFNYNLFMLKVRLSRKREAELSIYSQIKTEAGFNINNGFFNFITQGNNPYAGRSLDGAFDIKGGANVYTETGIGFRRQIYGKLSGGFKVGYIVGLANVTLDAKDTKLETTASGDSIFVTLNGTAKTSMDQNDLPGSVIDNLLSNNGIVFSGGLQYELSRKATISASVLDLGSITWNSKSKQYSLGKTVAFTGIPVLEEESVRDSIMDNLTKFATDSTEGSYTSALMTRIELTGQYRWANWFHQTAIISKPLTNNNIDLTLLHNLRIARRINFIFLTGYNTVGFGSVGAQFLLRTKGVDFYFGSEKVLNTVQIGQQMGDPSKKPTLGLGADFNFGLAWGFGRCPKKNKLAALPADADNDGVMDVIDDCPYAAGPIENKGCPWADTDGDGVLDKDDACINEAGPIENSGCPWPDTDGDGVLDKDDACPTAAGLAVNKGCPDTDGDGVYDKDDACPTVQGPIENLGCPWADTDNDSIPDKDDKCPNVAGPRSNDGCPLVPQKVELSVEDQEVINTVFSDLTFETGKAVIASSSYPALEALYALLIKKPSFKVLIEGHTDNVGNAANNKKLSQSRANAVKKYLEGKGIESRRLDAKGYGSAKPIADNKTAEGKAKNRRVEFAILE